jgi:hypothetical protein
MLRLRPSMLRDCLHNILESSRLFAMLKYLTFLCRPLSPYGILQQKLNSSFFPVGAASLCAFLEALPLSCKPMSQTIHQQFQCHNFNRRHSDIPSKPPYLPPFP